MNTGKYYSPGELLSTIAPMVGDKEIKIIPRGFYMSMIQHAFEDLNLVSFFAEKRIDIDFPMDTLTAKLPSDCFNVINVYLFQGDKCDIGASMKVWWKRNYYTNGVGYIANDKGNNRDPFYANHSIINNSYDKTLIRYDNETNVNSSLYYNIQGGNIMFSSSCKSFGGKIHLHYHSTGGDITDAEIIPVYFRTAIEDYVTEAALRFRMANEPSNIRALQPLYMMYAQRLDKEGYNGSWHNAIQLVKSMNSSQREELKEYLSRPAYSSGF